MHCPLYNADRTLLVTGAAVAAPGTSVRAEALAVRGGRVVHVGTAEDARAALGGRPDDALDLDLDLDKGLRPRRVLDRRTTLRLQARPAVEDTTATGQPLASAAWRCSCT
ncbi:hypothetical protein ACIA8E_39325 [Streptomyces sp. NPDC051664]|uniref:hypothetical protein n=1 Tax=Streptomyces sp. NPDC051664 TaxID=3365668 RepID=UPI0037AAC1B9